MLQETPNPEWIENDTWPPLVESSDESEYEMDPENQVMENENDREPNNQHYNLRRDRGMPVGYGDYLVHYFCVNV